MNLVKLLVNNKIAKNSWVGLIDQFGNGVLWLLILSFVGRSIEVQSFGQSLLAISFGEMFAVFSDFGIGYMNVRKTAINRSSTSINISNLLLLKLLFIFPALLIITVFVLFNYETLFLKLVIIACLAYTFKTTRVFLTSVFTGNERLELTAVSNFLYMGFVALVTVLLVNSGNKSASTLLLALLFGSFFSVSATLLLVNKFYRITWISPSIVNMGMLLKESIPYGFFFIGAFFYFDVDTFILSLIKGEEAVGLYQVSFRFIRATELIPAVLATAIYPAVSKVYLNDLGEAQIIVKQSLKYIILIAGFVGVLLFVLADPVIMLFFGQDYHDSILVLRILTFMIPFRALSHILGVSLTSIGRQSWRFIGVYFAAGTNIILNLVLIPRFSYYGTSVTAVITSILLFCIFYFSVRYQFKDLDRVPSIP